MNKHLKVAILLLASLAILFASCSVTKHRMQISHTHKSEYQIDTIHNALEYYQDRIEWLETKYIDGLDLRSSVSGKPFAWASIGSFWFLFIEEEDVYDIYYVLSNKAKPVILKKEQMPRNNEALSSLFAFSKGDAILYDLAKHEYNPMFYMLVLHDRNGEVKLAFDQYTIGAFKDTMESPIGTYGKDTLPLTLSQGTLLATLINTAIALTKD